MTSDNLKNFVRGYFEGDGSFRLVNIKNTKRIDAITFTCFSKETLLNLTEEIENVVPELKDKFKLRKYKKSVFSLELSHQRNITIFLNWLYKDSNIYLDRKYEIYKKYCRQ